MYRVKMKQILIVASLCSFLVGYAAAEARGCYSCGNSTDCNYPMNEDSEDVQISGCAWRENQTHNYECITIKATHSKYGLVTERGCINKTIDDMCSLFNQTFWDKVDKGNFSDLSCQTCTSDLCNNSGPWNIITTYLALIIGTVISQF